ncbi:LacI family transcriptional regulator [Pseudomonas sp. CGJS7]|uniref:LacI family transcriptional regulator n=1 Tax=Pseudomonas sp. CGJS7 TaxID=3109348 RepID=UPI00300A9364
MSRPNLEIIGDAEKRDVSDGSVALVVPIRLKRRSGRRLVQMQAAPDASRPWDKQKTPLQVALMRAHRWLAMLEEGEAASLSDIARRERTDVSYVARVLNLTTLAPEIVEAILDDTLPNTTFLNSIAINPLVDWRHQLNALQAFCNAET